MQILMDVDIPPESAVDSYAPGNKSQTKLALLEERNKSIEFVVVANDNSPNSMYILTGLKGIFQRQLPKMPKEYISRLVYDKSHFSMAIIKNTGSHIKILGGIAYRPFPQKKFAEIVFCAIDSTEQVKGITFDMVYLANKAHNVHHFLTYADNYAIGYFKKQGFTTDITFDKRNWMGYIKDYEGGTIMQCSMLEKVEYLDAYELIMAHRKAVFDKIALLSKSNVVHPGLKFKPGEVIDPESIPGLKEAGYRKNIVTRVMDKPRGQLYICLKKIIAEASANSASWPFMLPVAGVPDYYTVIKEPMDLKTLDDLVEKEVYKTIDEFATDLQKIFANCRAYNEDQSQYVKCANKLEKFCNEKIYRLRKEMGW